MTEDRKAINGVIPWDAEINEEKICSVEADGSRLSPVRECCQVNRGPFRLLAMVEAVTNILLLIFLILLELNCSCWQITSQLFSEKVIWHTLSFSTITIRQEAALLIPSIFSTMRFSKLSLKDSITIQKGRKYFN